MTELAVHEAQPLSVPEPLYATDPTGGRLVAWASGLAAAHRIGSALCQTSFCPQHFRGKPDEAAAAILFGDEIGLTPTQALRSVHVISGTPGLYARTMVALVQSHGHRVWTEKESPSEVTVCGQRRGETHIERSTWSLDRAQRAGYTRNAKYQTTPEDMLYARAAATVCRRIAPDALAGLAVTVEELELEGDQTTTDTQPARKRTAKRTLAPVPEPSLDAAAPDAAADEAATDQGDEPPLAPDDERFTPAQAASREQVVKLNIQLQEAGYTDRDEKLAWLSAVVGRDVTSSNDLTASEAHRLIDAFERGIELVAGDLA